MRSFPVRTWVAAFTTVAVSSLNAQSLEANFQATILVYGGPASVPSVAYAVPAGQNFSYFSDREVADDVTLAGSDRVLAGINFEYYANYAATAGLTFRMYERDNQGLPGELIYTKEMAVLQNGGIVNINFSYDATNLLPEHFFYSVQFDHATPGNVAGLIVPDLGPTTGSSADQVFEKRGNKWLELDLVGFRGRRLGVLKEGGKLKISIVDFPGTRVSVEAVTHLGEAWNLLGEVDTDDNGDAVFEAPDTEGTQRFYRTVSP
jgi:hypothetical protein